MPNPNDSDYERARAYSKETAGEIKPYYQGETMRRPINSAIDTKEITDKLMSRGENLIGEFSLTLVNELNRANKKKSRIEISMVEFREGISKVLASLEHMEQVKKREALLRKYTKAVNAARKLGFVVIE